MIEDTKLLSTQLLLQELVDNTGIFSELEIIEELADRIDRGHKAYHSHDFIGVR